MRWSYKTVHYEFRKEGLLGNAFLDESEIEESLNQFGRAGWELISLMNMRDGVIAVFKQPLSGSVSKDYEETSEDFEEVIAEPEHRSLSYLPAREIGRQNEPEPEPEEMFAAEVHETEKVEEAYKEEDDTEESESDIGAIRIE